MRLDDASVEAIARRVAELLRDAHDLPTAGDFIDAAEVARRFNISRDWVYAHADALGAKPLGNGERPRLRFDPAQVHERLGARPAPVATAPRQVKPRRRMAAPDLLPIRGGKP
jgi:hypothetical protein